MFEISDDDELFNEVCSIFNVAWVFLSVSVEYYNQISTYGINGCRSQLNNLIVLLDIVFYETFY